MNEELASKVAIRQGVAVSEVLIETNSGDPKRFFRAHTPRGNFAYSIVGEEIELETYNRSGAGGSGDRVNDWS